jgi:hypothetical protein
MGTRLLETDVTDELLRGDHGHLLIVTDHDNRGRSSLMLPFVEATVIQIEPREVPAIQVSFDTAVIDLDPFDRSIINVVTGCLQPGGRIVVMLPEETGGQLQPEAYAIAGLAWCGLAVVGGRLGVVLAAVPNSEAGPALSIPSHIAAAVQGYEVGMQASANLVAALLSRIDELQTSMAALSDLRRRSENALIKQIDLTLRELDIVRHDHRGVRLVRTILQRHKLGRVPLRLLRPVVRAARTLKRGEMPGKNRIRRVVVRKR